MEEMGFDEHQAMLEKFFADQKLHLDFSLVANYDDGGYDVWSLEGIKFGHFKLWWQAKREARRLQKWADAEKF